MKTNLVATIDGNEAVARVAYRLSEAIAIYPITPASPMGEWSDTWAAGSQTNLWGTVPAVVEMQSEGGAAGAVHGALQAGALTTTFTASQGLLLMLPNLFKIAGELTPLVIHIAARSLAAQGLSIFGDHSDVMAARMTGCVLLCSASVQEAQDFAAIATRATLESRLPFLHFFDGFRTSHEIQKVALLSDDDLLNFIPFDQILAFRARALTPDRPVIRGTAQNPDVYFQARETVNPFYDACPGIVQQTMDEFATLTGRAYRLFEYWGHPEAEGVIVLMGSGCESACETADYLNARGEKVGVLKVRLYRPWDSRSFINTLPATVRSIAVLDRTKEPGSSGEPLYQDVLTTIQETMFGSDTQLKERLSNLKCVVGGRYGLSSKEFNPAMVESVYANLKAGIPKNHFTVGINDDLNHSSLEVDYTFKIEPDSVVRALFYGLGSDGTVGANKNSIKILGEETDNYVQGYFVYDSKKSGSVTISHLRFGPEPIRSTYLITSANFIACHQWDFINRFDLLETAVEGATFLINSIYKPEELWDYLPLRVQSQISGKQLKVYTIDANEVAQKAGMGKRINTVMQVCFFALAGVLPGEEAIACIKQSIRKTYSKKGEAIVAMNIQAVDQTLDNLFPVSLKQPSENGALPDLPSSLSQNAPAFVHDVLFKMLQRQGDEIPVSALPCDGTYPSGTSRWEKRNIADEIPVWEPDICVQCGKCVMVCPHAVIRAKVYKPEQLANAPSTFKHTGTRSHEWKAQGLEFTIQVAPEDCTGCQICVDVCPAKDKSSPNRKAINMAPQPPLRETERDNWEFFLELPEPDRLQLDLHKIGHQQMQTPLFEFSGACGGCGETPYIKLATQLFGDRMLVANATGCSSIYGGNLPTTPWTDNAEGRGPAWSNSLFEDNAEFGLGFRVALDQHVRQASELLQTLATEIGDSLVRALLASTQEDEAEITEQRERVQLLKQRLEELLPLSSGNGRLQLENLRSLADYLIKKSVWIIGGDGWAYDIGYGGLDHVLASGRNVNLLVLDTEVYSNTGGQMSKSTPKGAVAKFAEGGKAAAKKDLGLIAMTYGNAYVASVAMGARDEHTLRAFLEAESYNGPSLIIAYSHCIAHGIDMAAGMQYQKAAVESGRWLLYRYDPRRREKGENPLQLDSRSPKLPLADALYRENRFAMLARSNPQAARELLTQAQSDVNTRYQMYQYLAALSQKGE